MPVVAAGSCVRIVCWMSAAIPFNANELMELLRGLERRKIAYQIEYRRTTESCDGITVRILTGLDIWEVGFFDYDHIEVLRFTSSNVETGVTAASLLSDLDALETSH
jgi:hypothetical protein